MDKETYLRFLRALLLNRMPEADAEDIIRFYTEYLEEAGDKAQEAMAALGSPEELTEKIMEQRAREETEGLREPSGPAFGTQTVPGGSGLPRWLGILLVVLAGSCIVPTLGGLVLGFGVAGIGVIVGGALVFAFGVFGVGLGSAVYAAGVALVMTSVGSLLVQAAKGIFYLMKKSVIALWNALVGEVSFREAIN